MDDCKHGLQIDTCYLCRKVLEVVVKAPSQPKCCSPNCPKTATKQVATLPLCPDHYHRLETQIAQTYSPKPPAVPPSGRLLDDDLHEWVYFVQLDEVIKIGVSIHPSDRIRLFSTYGHHVTVLALERGSYALEKRLHRRFAEHRAQVGLSRELFHPAPAILDYIANGRRCTYCREIALPGRLICEAHLPQADTLARYEQLIGGQLDIPTAPEAVSRTVAR